MKKIIVICFFLMGFISISAYEIQILFTNDEHGQLFNEDFRRQTTRDYSLLNCATLIKQLRKANPHTMVLSGGDTFQGSPLTYFSHYIDTLNVNPMVQAMNVIGYQALSLGNHDIEQGLDYLLQIQKQALFPFLSANAWVGDRRDTSYFTPYICDTLDGVVIAVLGLTTPGIPLWLNASLYPGITFGDMAEAARYWVPYIRKAVNPDILIGLFHSSINEEWDRTYCEEKGIPPANDVLNVARSAPEFDLILTAHSHKLIADTINEDLPAMDPINRIGKTRLAQAGAYGRYLGVCTFSGAKNEQRFTLDSLRVQVLPANMLPPDSQLLQTMQPAKDKLIQYLNDSLTTATAEFSAYGAQWRDNPLIDLIHQAQLDFTRADISITATFSPWQKIGAGAVRTFHILDLYPYENTLVITRMTGDQIRRYLEYNARFFNRVAQEVTSIDRDSFFNPEVRWYNFDTIEGLRYTLDVTQAVGQRVKNLSTLDGRLLPADTSLTVAMNSYRYNGGGGFLAALGVSQLPLVREYPDLLPQIICRYLKNKPVITPVTNRNWQLVPASLQIKN